MPHTAGARPLPTGEEHSTKTPVLHQPQLYRETNTNAFPSLLGWSLFLPSRIAPSVRAPSISPPTVPLPAHVHTFPSTDPPRSFLLQPFERLAIFPFFSPLLAPRALSRPRFLPPLPPHFLSRGNNVPLDSALGSRRLNLCHTPQRDPTKLQPPAATAATIEPQLQQQPGVATFPPRESETKPRRARPSRDRQRAPKPPADRPHAVNW